MFVCFSFLTKITVLCSLFFVNAVENRRTAEHELDDEAMSCVSVRIRTSSFVSGCVLCPFPSSSLLFHFCRHFSDFYLPQRRFHQWFLLFGVNIPNVSLFIYCISAITERFCWGCVKHTTLGNHNTDHNARLEREMLNLTVSSCSVCLGPSHKGFCFKLYNVEK